MKEEIRYLSLCGMLGYGYAPESLENAFAGKLDFIGVDAGSTDPGPYYLGSGNGFVKPLQVKRDLSLVLKRALEQKIPFIIGSAGCKAPCGKNFGNPARNSGRTEASFQSSGYLFGPGSGGLEARRIGTADSPLRGFSGV